jgi:peptidylprolyl isomerase
MNTHTKNWQRIVIWIIAFVLTFGTLGFYFMIIMQNNSQANMPTQSELDQTNQQQEELQVDQTAYIVNDDIKELKIEDQVEGTGEAIKEGDSVRVHYKGTIAQTGQKIDSSYDRGEPVEFALGEVIVGWQQGMPGMKVGGKRRLIIPSELAYGAAANGAIPANSDLVFEIELLAINPTQ